MFHFLFQRKRFFLFLLLGILCVSLVTLGADKNRQQFPAVKAFQTFFSYPLDLSMWCVKAITGTWHRYIYLVHSEKRNEALQQEINFLSLENQQLREHLHENQRLRALLDFKQHLSYKMLPAEIIGRDPSSWFKTIIINKGHRSGVQPGSGVVSPKGVVGTVIETTPHSSSVLLITDQNSTIDVLIQRTRVRGILEGQTEKSCKVNYVVKNEDIQINDAVITSGLNAVFPAGIFVGSVIETNNNPDGFFRYITVAPAVDFSKITEVLVVLMKEPEPGKEKND
jgi:rod shape-determining protein MreC